jgi:hypothetical protein
MPALWAQIADGMDALRAFALYDDSRPLVEYYARQDTVRLSDQHRLPSAAANDDPHVRG